MLIVHLDQLFFCHSLPQVFADIPEDLPVDASFEFIRAMVRTAIMQAYTDEAKDTCRFIRLQTNPTKSLFAKVQIPKKELMLVPLTTEVRIFANASEVTANVKLVKGSVFENPKTGDTAVIGLVEKKMARCDKDAARDDHFPIPYWLVFPTMNSAEANVVESLHKVVMEISRPDGTKEKLCIEIPILTNEVTLKANTELKIFRAQKKRHLDVVDDRPSKAAKGRGRGRARGGR